MNIIFKMIKFTLLALLCLGLANGLYQEDKVGEDGYHLEVNFNDGDCCKDMKDPDASLEDEPVCLNSKNSKLIADQTLVVLKANDQSYAAIKALKIPEFMVGKITYQEWSDNIVFNDYNLDGYTKLKKLVTKYVLCKKVCKVFFYLRDSIRQYGAQADIDNAEEPEGRFLNIAGELIILSDVKKDAELNFAAALEAGEEPFVGINFEAETLIIDAYLLENKGWAGKLIRIDARNVIVPKTVGWYVGGDGECKYKLKFRKYK